MVLSLLPRTRRYHNICSLQRHRSTVVDRVVLSSVEAAVSAKAAVSVEIFRGQIPDNVEEEEG